METPAVKAQRLLEQLYRVRQGQEDKVPKGYLSIEDLMKHWGLKRSQTRLNVLKLVKAGQLKEVTLRRFVGKKIRVVNYYG